MNNSNNIIYHKIDYNKYNEHCRLNGFKSGKCVSDSLKIYQKLFKIGSKRVRGKINRPEIFKVVDDETDLTHYWVEAKGMVYDINNYQKIIMPIDEYYQELNISDVEYADYGIFNTNNNKLGSGPDSDEIIINNIVPKCNLIVKKFK